MLYRFSLYGFLKNQRYFEPFLVLFFLEKGLDFLQIGLLVAFRELVINLLEILSGAVADLWGRRRAMILSFSSCMVSFAVFALADSLGLLFFAMFLFGTGESFRTGTHKAMIFSWLRAQGRTAERTLIYGTTRSWSKIGSAVSVILAAVFVLASDNYAIVFWLAMIPYTMGIINFLTYPKELDGTRKSGFSPRVVLAHLRQSLSAAWRQRPIRRLVFESMGFEGVFRAAKDYLQPVIQAAALSTGSLLALGTTMGERQRVALLVGPIYFVLYMLSALASRRAYRLAARAGSEEHAARSLWAMYLIGFVILLPCMIFDLETGIIAGFVYLFVLQNLWRPMLVSRFDAACDERQGATLLSVENQAKTFSTMLVAPLMGGLVDLVRGSGFGGEFWPVGAIGASVALAFLLFSPRGLVRTATGESCTKG